MIDPDRVVHNLPNKHVVLPVSLMPIKPTQSDNVLVRPSAVTAQPDSASSIAPGRSTLQSAPEPGLEHFVSFALPAQAATAQNCNKPCSALSGPAVSQRSSIPSCVLNRVVDLCVHPGRVVQNLPNGDFMQRNSIATDSHDSALLLGSTGRCLDPHLAAPQFCLLLLAPLSNLRCHAKLPTPMLLTHRLPTLPLAVRMYLMRISCFLPSSPPSNASSCRLTSPMISGKVCCTKACRMMMTLTLTRSPMAFSSVASLSSGLFPGLLPPSRAQARAPTPAPHTRVETLSAAAVLLRMWNRFSKFTRARMCVGTPLV